jgi:hypothetical protein
LCFSLAIEYLHVQAFIAELAVETLSVTILPGTARLDVVRMDALGLQPALDRFGCELRTIVAAQVLGTTSLSKDPLEHLNNGLGRQATGYLQRQAFPRELVDQRQALQGAAIGGHIKHEIIGPDMVGITRCLRHLRSLPAAQMFLAHRATQTSLPP